MGIRAKNLKSLIYQGVSGLFFTKRNKSVPFLSASYFAHFSWHYLSWLIKQMAERERVSEKLKAENQMLWVGKMNAIREAATEIVNGDLIYA